MQKNYYNTSSVQELRDKMELMDKKIDVVLALLEKLVGPCQTMKNHVDKVEYVYNSLRKPFSFLKDKINYISGSNLPNLPVLDNGIKAMELDPSFNV